MARQCVKKGCTETPRKGFRVCDGCRGWIEKKQREALSRVKTVPEAVEILSPDSEFSPRTNKSDEEE